jgi:hypothetical protein
MEYVTRVFGRTTFELNIFIDLKYCHFHMVQHIFFYKIDHFILDV